LYAKSMLYKPGRVTPMGTQHKLVSYRHELFAAAAAAVRGDWRKRFRAIMPVNTGYWGEKTVSLDEGCSTVVAHLRTRERRGGRRNLPTLL
jgi:hypothetical protein